MEGVKEEDQPAEEVATERKEGDPTAEEAAQSLFLRPPQNDLLGVVPATS